MCTVQPNFLQAAQCDFLLMCVHTSSQEPTYVELEVSYVFASDLL